MAAFDNLPEAYLPQPTSAGYGHEAVWTHTESSIWRQDVVTVAFNGGDEAAFRLLEETAREWTHHSRRFTFSFRLPDGQFRRWSESDQTPAADIRVSFHAVGPLRGQWSVLGALARQERRAHEPTMNLEGFPEAARALGGDRDAWLRSYMHSVALHELGHALGLAHEHFHPACQADLKLDPDSGYQRRRDPTGRFLPDNRGRSPGAVLAFQGAPNGWRESVARVNLIAAEFFPSAAIVRASPQIDQHSVMLYTFDEFLLRSGARSPCISRGEGVYRGRRYAIQLSAGDISYFKTYYDAPNPGSL